MKKTDQLDFLPAALEIQERPPSPAGRAILWSLVLFFTIAVSWAFVGEVDIVATAQGKIIPSGHVKTIQPLEIGVVRQVHVREGQAVQAGDILVELDPTSTQADVRRLQKEHAVARLDHHRYQRLVALTNGEALSPVPDASPFPNVTEPLQNQLLRSEWAEFQARLAALDNTISSRDAELAANQDEVRKLESTLPLITRRSDSLKTLLKDKLYSEQSWLELEEERVTQQQDLAAFRNRARQTSASIREARQQRIAVEQEFRRTMLTKLAEAERSVSALEQELVKAEQRTQLQALRSPIDGIVQQLAVHTVGGVVTPAQELMKIVPQGSSLEVEAWVLNKDIGFVEEAQTAEIKVETFPFTRYGTIDGKIVDVSNDAVSDEKQGLVYAARVLMEQTVIKVNEKLVKLAPGMAVTVEVKTGKRRLIEFVLSPLLRYRDEGLKER